MIFEGDGPAAVQAPTCWAIHFAIDLIEGIFQLYRELTAFTFGLNDDFGLQSATSGTSSILWCQVDKGSFFAFRLCKIFRVKLFFFRLAFFRGAFFRGVFCGVLSWFEEVSPPLTEFSAVQARRNKGAVRRSRFFIGFLKTLQDTRG
jgi:hypothetical protein